MRENIYTFTCVWHDNTLNGGMNTVCNHIPPVFEYNSLRAFQILRKHPYFMITDKEKKKKDSNNVRYMCHGFVGWRIFICSLLRLRPRQSQYIAIEAIEAIEDLFVSLKKRELGRKNIQF